MHAYIKNYNASDVCFIVCNIFYVGYIYQAMNIFSFLSTRLSRNVMFMSYGNIWNVKLTDAIMMYLREANGQVTLALLYI